MVQLLGLNARELYLDPQLIHAYEELSAAPVEDGFTTQAAQGRAVLLQEAVQVNSSLWLWHAVAFLLHKFGHCCQLLDASGRASV